jgi:H+/Cl- antiporter ClcA
MSWRSFAIDAIAPIVLVLAGASNAPLASTFMGIELFGPADSLPIAIARFVACLCSGHSALYLFQRIAVRKQRTGSPLRDRTLRDARQPPDRCGKGQRLRHPLDVMTILRRRGDV